jgi:hypothetical protein
MPAGYPTRRPTEAESDTSDPFDPPAELLNRPWIDVHNHAHTLSWADRERFSLAGCRSMVMVAAGHHWTPYRPVRAEDVRYLWDDALARRSSIERDHFVEATLAVGVHTGVRVEDPDALLDAMGPYCELEEVVAVGETGVTPTQQRNAWPMEEQRAVVRAQMALADDHDLPVLLHTPYAGGGTDRSYRPGVGVPGFETATGAGRERVLDGENPALESVEHDIEAADEAGLAEERIVASHADPNNVDYLLGSTDCYVSFTLGHSWLSGVTAADVAAAIEEYGSERITVDTDCANVLRTDPFAIKRAMLELYRLGVDEADVRRVVFENPREVFDVAG